MAYRPFPLLRKRIRPAWRADIASEAMRTNIARTRRHSGARFRFRHRRRGVAMLLALIVLTVASVIAYSYLSTQSTSVGIARNVSNHAKARYIAETGLELAIAYVTSGADWRTDKVNGTWASHQAFAGGTYTIVGDDGEDLDGDGSDPLTITVTGSANGATHIARAIITLADDRLLINGGFEESLGDGNDQPDPGWDGQDARKLTIVNTGSGQVYEDDYAIFFDLDNSGVGGASLNQQITGLTPGDTYTLTAYVHLISIEEKNAQSNPLFNLSISELKVGAALVEHIQTAPTADWLEVTLNVTAPANGELWIRAQLEEVKSASLYLDGMTFEGPEGGGGSVSYSVNW